MAKRGLPREKVLATVVRLLENTLIRVGNDEYAKQNKSFGLTTLQDRHVEIDGASCAFEFKGKSGKIWKLAASRTGASPDRQGLPGPARAAPVPVSSTRTANATPSRRRTSTTICGRSPAQDFTAKDFRTWAGTVLAALALHRVRELRHQDAAPRRTLCAAIERVS